MASVSVIVPLYNVEDYVGECIASLKAQTFGDFEAVCVNDGSTDSSLECAKAAAADDGRFVFVERENGGLSAARNTGLAHAMGEYVSFLDSDDKYAPNALEVLYGYASENDLDLLDFSAESFTDAPKVDKALDEDLRIRKPHPGVFTGRELMGEYYKPWPRQYLSSACLHLVRRKLLEEYALRFYEGILYEDELFTPQLYAWAKRAAFLDENLYLRRVRPGSIMTSQQGIKRIDAMFRITQMLEEWLAEHASELEGSFVHTWALNLVDLRYLAYRECKEIPEEELLAYADSLGPRDRADFEVRIRTGGGAVAAGLDDILSSRAYRLGSKLAAVPRRFRR